jgi:hypothetical protein
MRYQENAGDQLGAGATRSEAAQTLARNGRRDEALFLARAAVRDFERFGPGAADLLDVATKLVAGFGGAD